MRKHELNIVNPPLSPNYAYIVLDPRFSLFSQTGAFPPPPIYEYTYTLKTFKPSIGTLHGVAQLVKYDIFGYTLELAHVGIV